MVRHLKVCYSINNDRLCLPMFSTKNVVRRDCLLSLIFITNSLEIGAYAQLYFSTFINDSTFITNDNPVQLSFREHGGWNGPSLFNRKGIGNSDANSWA